MLVIVDKLEFKQNVEIEFEERVYRKLTSPPSLTCQTDICIYHNGQVLH
jgi:hypothetical protein